MHYNLKATGITLTPEVREYLDKKLTHLDRLATQPEMQLNIELQFSSAATGPKYRAEFNLSLGKELTRAEASGDTLHSTIDIAANELHRKLTRDKKKRLHRLRHMAVRAKRFIRGWGREEE
ncbi:MAG: ribosome-associated translation inhibitor RaiA [Patescibacteria group bacterium]|nr:ribosome-associated translation inhibitor RaiA [Patescibacteria group bacterium]